MSKKIVVVFSSELEDIKVTLKTKGKRLVIDTPRKTVADGLKRRLAVLFDAMEPSSEDEGGDEKEPAIGFNNDL